MSVLLLNWKVLGTPWLLEQWGLWSRVEQNKMGFPKAANFAQFQGGSIRTPEIHDDLAIAVDRIVKLSCVLNPNYEIAICSRYVKKRTQFQMAKDLHTNRTEAVQILHLAEAWIDGYLHSVAHDLASVGVVDLGDETDELKSS